MLYTKTAKRPRIRLCIASIGIALATFGCNRSGPTAEQLLDRGNKAFAAEQYRGAESAYLDVLRLAPGDPTATRALGLIYHRQGQVPQAEPLLKKAAEQHPEDPDIQLALGFLLLAEGELVGARDAAFRILEKVPGDERGLLLLVEASVTLETTEQTRAAIEGLRQKDQDRPGYHLALGVLSVRGGDRQGAEAEYRAALRLNSSSADAHAALGTLHWSCNEIEAADAELRKASELAPPYSPLRLRYAEFKRRTGAGEDGAALLRKLSDQYPDYLPPGVALMNLACAKRRDDQCAARVKNVLDQDPRNVDAVFQNGLLSLAKNDAPNAIMSFEYLSKAYASNAEIRYQLAFSYLQHANSPVDSGTRSHFVRGAEIALREALRLNPRHERAALLLAEMKLKDGNSAAAIPILLPLSEQNLPNSRALYLLAAAYTAQQRGNEAIQIYRRLAEMLPKDPQPTMSAATVWLSMDKQLEARTALEAALEIAPDYLAALEALTDLDLVQGQPAAALRRLQDRIDAAPRAELLAMRGKLYLAQRDYAKAETDLLMAADLNPRLETSYLLLARLYLAMNEPARAAEKLSISLEHNKTAPALLLLGIIQEHLKNRAAAQGTYEKLLADFPDFAPAMNNLAAIYSADPERLEKAYELAKRATELDPNNPFTADTLGWILFKKREYVEAVRLLRVSAAKVPDNGELQFHAGMALYMTGQQDAARGTLQRAVDAAGDFEGKAEGRERLALLSVDAEGANARTELTTLPDEVAKRSNGPCRNCLRFSAKTEMRQAALKSAEQGACGLPGVCAGAARVRDTFGTRTIG